MRGRGRSRRLSPVPAPKPQPLAVSDLRPGAVYDLERSPFSSVVAVPGVRLWSFLSLRPKGRETYLVYEDRSVEQLSGEGAGRFLTLDDFSPTGETLPVPPDTTDISRRSSVPRATPPRAEADEVPEYFYVPPPDEVDGRLWIFGIRVASLEDDLDEDWLVQHQWKEAVCEICGKRAFFNPIHVRDAPDAAATCCDCYIELLTPGRANALSPSRRPGGRPKGRDPKRRLGDPRR